MKHPPHVALIIETSKQYGRGLIMGIAHYLKGHGPWSVYIEERAIEDPVPTWMRKWKGDGIIARVNSDAMAKSLLGTGVPVVNVRRFQTKVEMPAVFEDDYILCQLALSHFTEHRFRNFGYCGWPHILWSHYRGLHFADVVRAAGFNECHMYAAGQKGARSWEQEQDDVSAWLKSLPTPIAIMASNDVRGLQVLDACRRVNLPVPEQCAVLGVDNEVMLCELADPPLSSIDQDEEKTGYEAAAMLDRMMRGEPAMAPGIAVAAGSMEAKEIGSVGGFAAGSAMLIKPLGVVARSSTDSMAVEDADIAKALRFIRVHACERIGIDDVATHACLSRRVLQRRFKKLLGRSPLEEIFLVQMGRIQQMLVETDMKLHAIAERAGFAYVGHMSSFFKGRTGLTCGEYREKARAARGRS